MKFTTLAKLHTYYDGVCECKLKNTAKQAVFGNGNPKARVVFIGEAPGKKEDETGIPFVGAAGKFLQEMLHSIKMDRADVYITNTVKYRPPENRDPTPAEKQQCREWLVAELNYIKPDLIVFLGRHAMNSFFPEMSISEMHGKVIDTKKYNDLNKKDNKNSKLSILKKEVMPVVSELKTTHFLPLYHPAAALYNGGMRVTLLKDFKKIPKILKQIS